MLCTLPLQGSHDETQKPRCESEVERLASHPARAVAESRLRPVKRFARQAQAALFAPRQINSVGHRVTWRQGNEIGTWIVIGAVHLHQDLGPGLLETVYEVTLAAKLRKRGLAVERQVPISIEWQGQRFAARFRADLIVEGKLIVERKSVERVHPAHKKQVLHDLRLTRMQLGSKLNHGEALMQEGITRIDCGEC